MTTKALVIGGGIGGLSTALALQRRGLEAHVFEGADGLREIGAGVMIWANAVKALDHMGLSDSLRQITSPLHAMQTRTTGGRVLQTIPLSKTNEKLGYDSVGFHRRELLQLLADAVDPASLHVGARLARFEQNGTTVAAFFDDGRAAEGNLLIAADGIFSTVRRQLFSGLDPHYAGYVVWRGVANLTPQHDWPPHSVVRTMGREKHFGIAQLSEGRYFWYGTRDESLDEPEEGGRKATLMRHFGEWHSPIPALLEATPEEDMLRHGIYELHPLKKWTNGRVTLLGDAAHPMKPSLGMGACQAIEDAVVLSYYMGKDEVPDALKSYEGTRKARTKQIVRWSHLLARTEQFKSRAMCSWRDLGTRLLPEPVSLWITERSLSFELPRNP
jgi:FAD-dependent urate hydroxylase